MSEQQPVFHWQQGNRFADAGAIYWSPQTEAYYMELSDESEDDRAFTATYEDPEDNVPVTKVFRPLTDSEVAALKPSGHGSQFHGERLNTTR